MKTIALIPFKNEEYILPTCLTSLKTVCDEIICVNDNSNDASVEIAKSFGCKVYDNELITNIGWNEHPIREKLLRLGREAGGTHFICLDADEALTTPFAKRWNQIANSMKPGQKISMQWLALWKCLDHYRDDQSVWSNNFKDFVVCDDGKIGFEYKWMHVARTPGVNNENTLLKLNPKHGAVLHYQFSNWTNFQIKQCYMRCAELIKNPGSEKDVNAKYGITLDDNKVVLREIPKDWQENYPMPELIGAKLDWRLERIESYFKEYGHDFFKALDIWHVPEIKRLAMQQ